MDAMKIGPLALFTNFGDRWLVSRQARTLFLCSTVLVLLLSLPLFGWVSSDPFQHIPWSIVAMIGVVGMFFLWFGMWRYWYRIDNSGVWSKRFWFFVLLIGFCWGGCLYFLTVYLPHVTRRGRQHA